MLALMAETQAAAAPFVPARAPCGLDGAVAGFRGGGGGEALQLDVAGGET